MRWEDKKTSILSLTIILLNNFRLPYINCGHQGAAINMQGIETPFECVLLFYFHFEIRDYTDSMDRQYLPHILQD